jgi:hypothetical protein
MKKQLRKLAATLLLAAAVTGIAASQAGATIVPNSWWMKDHWAKPTCTMHVKLDESHSTSSSGQRLVDVRALGTVVCDVSGGTNRTTQPEINLKIDGAVAPNSTQTTAVWRDTYGMGRDLSRANWLWSLTNPQSGCHYYQGIFKAWVNGYYDYVTTYTPKWICA